MGKRQRVLLHHLRFTRPDPVGYLTPYQSSHGEWGRSNSLAAPLKRRLPASSPILPKPSGLRDLNHIPAVSDDIFAHNAPQIVKYLNRQMVSLVNNLYDLADKELKIVESET